MEYRKSLLERLRELQSKVGDVLITSDEEAKIHQIWAEEAANLALRLERDMEAGE
jgi:hypothetical protein